MKLGKGVPSVWPGYVAAVASLVLSLLLLLAILVFAMTQIENLVARYDQEILRARLQQEVDAGQTEPTTRPVSPAPVPVSPKPEAPKPSAKDNVVAKTSKTEAPLPDQIRLIFEAGVGDVSAQAAQELAAVVARLNAAKPLYWRIQAATLASDPVMEKTSYRLMMKVNQLLREQGIDEKRIQLRLQKSTVLPKGYADGEIVVTLEWFASAPWVKGQP
jgi:hypothetical protein